MLACVLSEVEGAQYLITVMEQPKSKPAMLVPTADNMLAYVRREQLPLWSFMLFLPNWTDVVSRAAGRADAAPARARAAVRADSMAVMVLSQ